MITMFKRLVSCQGDFAKTVTSLLPQLTVLAHVTQLTPCHVIAVVSPIDSFCEYICNVSFRVQLLPHWDVKCRWEDIGYCSDFVISPFAFDPV
jgi:hypothetical protein